MQPPLLSGPPPHFDHDVFELKGDSEHAIKDRQLPHQQQRQRMQPP